MSRTGKMRLNAIFIGLALLFCASSALASAPPEISSVIHSDKPLGSGKYTFLLMTAYDAELWTDAPKWSMQSTFALTLYYHVSFSTDEFVSRAHKEMQRVEPSLSDATLTHFDRAMRSVFPAVKSGDEITALYQPGHPVRFFRNGQPIGEIDLEGFAEPFFGIWLSPNTSATGLRDQLLGSNDH